MRAALALLALLAAAPALGAEPFDAGAPKGAEQTAYLERIDDSYDLPVTRFTAQVPGTEPVTGRITWAGFRLADPDATTEAVMAGYRARLTEAGFSAILDCANTACGGFDFRFGASILPAPGMLLDASDFRQLTLRRGDGEAHVSVLVSRVLEAVYIQTVSVIAGIDPAAISPAPKVETAPETVILPLDERALFDELTRNGHVAVSGLEFDTGGAALSAGSGEAIALLARLLARNGDLAVVIVGHSDNEGSLDANIDLSQRRAVAVRTALIKEGVTAARLEARGVGYLAPVTSNATPDGRAANRRVELVLR